MQAMDYLQPWNLRPKHRNAANPVILPLFQVFYAVLDIISTHFIEYNTPQHYEPAPTPLRPR